MNRKDYEEDLKRKQKEHLRNVRGGENDPFWQPCQHDQCMECHGTGIKLNGSNCTHNLYCSCPRCSPMCVMSLGKTTSATTLDQKLQINYFGTSDTSCTQSSVTGQ